MKLGDEAMEFALNETVTGNEIKKTRKKLNMTQQQFASFCKVSKKTVENWEYSKKEIQGPIVALLKIINEYEDIVDRLTIPEKKAPLRLWYMFQSEVCTIIDVDEVMMKVNIYNYTNNLIKRAFGKNDKPSFQEYEEFLESRCFPRTRDKMKLILKELDIPYYDPFLIIEKTKGKMADDDFWIRIER